VSWRECERVSSTHPKVSSTPLPPFRRPPAISEQSRPVSPGHAASTAAWRETVNGRTCERAEPLTGGAVNERNRGRLARPWPHAPTMFTPHHVHTPPHPTSEHHRIPCSQRSSPPQGPLHSKPVGTAARGRHSSHPTIPTSSYSQQRQLERPPAAATGRTRRQARHGHAIFTARHIHSTPWARQTAHMASTPVFTPVFTPVPVCGVGPLAPRARTPAIHRRGPTRKGCERATVGGGGGSTLVHTQGGVNRRLDDLSHAAWARQGAVVHTSSSRGRRSHLLQ